MGKHKKAIEAYRQILAKWPDDSEVHTKIAPLLQDAGELNGFMRLIS